MEAYSISGRDFMTADSAASPPPPPASPTKKRLGRGCLWILGLTAAMIAVLVAVSALGPVFEKRARQREADRLFDPTVEKLRQQAAEAPPEWNRDKTIRVVYGMDQAIASRDELSIGEWLELLARQDYEGVHPKVLESRAKMLEILKETYIAVAERERREDVWKGYSGSLSELVSLADVSFSGLLPVAISLNREKLDKRSEDWKKHLEELAASDEKIRALDVKLMDALVDYSTVWFEVVREWDRLCLHRDRAYLAARSGDWPTALAASKEALALAPDDRESLILAAWAACEGEGIGETPTTNEEAQGYLGRYMELYPDQTAPALLLSGVIEERRGNRDAARLHYEQASAYFPKQSEKLGDMLDPYRMRSFLRRSEEGRVVLEGYRNTMLGAGPFSPNLRLALMERQSTTLEGSWSAVLDHFSRRRAQQAFDFILADLEYCESELGLDFYRMFPEQFFLDLDFERTKFGYGNELAFEVENKTSMALHNVTLVLCLHFTDMVRGDYEAVPLPKTAAVLAPSQKTDFGNLKIDYELLGKKKGPSDVVECRAILISNEGVFWVDTREFKAERIKTAMRAETPAADLFTDAVRSDYLDSGRIADWLGAVVARREDNLGVEKLVVELPNELAILRPFFQLQQGDKSQTVEPAFEIVGDDTIQLSFEKVKLLSTFGKDGTLKLVIDTPYGRFEKPIELAPKAK